MDRDKAFEVEQGFLIEGGSFITSGATSPIGAVTAEAGDFYIQKSNPPVLFLCTGATANDWRQLQVKDALNVYSLETHTTTLNGTDSLTQSSVTLHRLTGTATGFSVELPDASTIEIGRRFEISNESSETVNLKDGSGATLFELIEGDFAVATLEANGSQAGTWIVTVISSAATGITSYSIGSDTLFSTTSMTDVLITGMTITPVTGRYAAWFSGDIEIAQNNKLADVTLYVDGVSVERTRREVQGVSSNFKAAFITIGELVVNGAQAIDVRVNISGGSLDVNQRRLILIRLGA